MALCASFRARATFRRLLAGGIAPMRSRGAAFAAEVLGLEAIPLTTVLAVGLAGALAAELFL